ncbi:MAG: EpsD family peptidyl-prolyl cis-trans isomerase [Thiobacillaceae bacterium]
MNSLSTRVAAVSIIAFSLVMQGCGEKKATGESGKDTQVAARVNGNEITVHQINAAVQRVGKIPEDKLQAVSDQALNTLVNQQLLVQKAIADKLDRNPQVMQAIEAARDEILAQSYIQSKVQSAPKPSDAEVSDFITQHPELFSDRRLYRLQEITIQGAADKSAQIRSQLTASKNVDEFAQWLKAQNFKFNANQADRSAEQLPLGLAKQLMNVKPGQAIIANNNGALIVILVAAAASQPITGDQAKAAAEKVLTGQKQRQMAEDEIKSLRAAAKIEYMGAFKDMGTESAKPAEQTAPPKPAESSQPDSKNSGTAAPNADAIKKGLSGL